MHEEAGVSKSMLEEIKRMDLDCDGLLITFYDIRDKGDSGSENDLAHFLLNAVVNLRLKGLTGEHVSPKRAELAASKGSDLARALELAVKWDRPSVAKEIIDALGSMRTAFPDGVGSTPAVRAALQLAVGKARVEFVAELLKQPGMAVTDINMLKLYLLPGRFCFVKENPLLKRGFSHAFRGRRADSQMLSKGKRGGDKGGGEAVVGRLSSNKQLMQAASRATSQDDLNSVAQLDEHTHLDYFNIVQVGIPPLTHTTLPPLKP